MKTSLKTLVRAISPFTKAKPEAAQQPPQKTKVEDFHWDISKVDMVAMLSNFYAEYNPDRVRTVHEILHQYEGEEVEMLQQLCDRYNLTEADIQSFLDNAPLGRRERFENWTKKKSGGSVSNTDPDNASVDDSKGNRPRSGYGGFVWDLSSVDLAKALKLLYRKHNPTKTPNVSSLDNKTENERILLLQQLCKRHTLTQADMQHFLDKARIKDKDDSSYNTNDSRYGSKGKTRSGMNSAAASDNGSQAERSAPFQKPVVGSDVASSLLSSFQRQLKQSGSERDEDAQEMADTSSQDSPRVISGQRAGSLPFWNSLPMQGGAVVTSPPPPPPPAPSIFDASVGARPPPPGAPAGLPFSHVPRQSTSPASVASSVNSSVTAGSISRSALGRLDTATSSNTNNKGGRDSASRTNSRYSPSPAPSVASVGGGTGGARKGYGAASRQDDEQQQQQQQQAETMTIGSAAGSRASVVSRSNSRTGKSVAPTDSSSTAGGSSRSAEGARAAELLDLQRELSEARLQVVSARKENQALMKALQDSKQRQSDAESIVSELSSHQAHLDQVPDLLNQVSKLNSTLKQQEEREVALKRQYNQQKQQVQSLQEQLVAVERQCAEVSSDNKNVLRLIDVMSASPAGIKSVLEAYLKQLGEATGSVPVKFGIGTDGRQIPISERISLALRLKREQEQDNAVAKGGDRSAFAASGGSGHNTPVKSRGGNGASSGAVNALERQQDSYQQFKETVSQQQHKKQQREQEQSLLDARHSDRNAHSGVDDSTEPDSDTEDHQEDQPAGGEQEFLDYASPEAGGGGRKAKGATRRKNAADEASGQGGQGQEDMQHASLASGLASDWIECLDPRSKRKYYYSAALKKSTWAKPAGFSSSGIGRAAGSTSSSGNPVLASMGVTMPSRYNSPNVSMHMSGRQPQLQQQQQSAPVSSSSSSSSSRNGGVGSQRMTADELGGEESFSSAQQQQQQSAGHPSSLRSASPYNTPNTHMDFSNVFTSSANNPNSTSRSNSSDPASRVSNSYSNSNSAYNSAYNSRSSSPATSTKSILRNGSPGGVRGGAGQQSPATTSRQLGSSSKQGQQGQQEQQQPQDWVTAVDPNSNRKYWYNRKTKVSTWRQPAELII